MSLEVEVAKIDTKDCVDPSIKTEVLETSVASRHQTHNAKTGLPEVD